MEAEEKEPKERKGGEKEAKGSGRKKEEVKAQKEVERKKAEGAKG